MSSSICCVEKASMLCSCYMIMSVMNCCVPESQYYVLRSEYT